MMPGFLLCRCDSETRDWSGTLGLIAEARFVELTESVVACFCVLSLCVFPRCAARAGFAAAVDCARACGF